MRLVIPAPMAINVKRCPNVGCSVMDTSTGITDHLMVCPLQEVECPGTGCYDIMLRCEVDQHVQRSAWEHIRKAVFIEKLRAFEMAEMQARIYELEDLKTRVTQAGAAIRPSPATRERRNKAAVGHDSAMGNTVRETPAARERRNKITICRGNSA
jgi:hypothetical protein